MFGSVVVSLTGVWTRVREGQVHEKLLHLSSDLSLQARDYDVFRLGAKFLSKEIDDVCHIRFSFPIHSSSFTFIDYLSSKWKTNSVD